MLGLQRTGHRTGVNMAGGTSCHSFLYISKSVVSREQKVRALQGTCSQKTCSSEPVQGSVELRCKDEVSDMSLARPFLAGPGVSRRGALQHCDDCVRRQDPGALTIFSDSRLSGHWEDVLEVLQHVLKIIQLLPAKTALEPSLTTIMETRSFPKQCVH